MQKLPNAAEEYWNANTEECPDLPNRKPSRIAENLREKFDAIAWIEWNEKDRVAALIKIERLQNTHKGGGEKLLKFILSVCDQFSVELRGGNAQPYSPYDDAECTQQDVERLIKWYKRNGVSVCGRANEIRYIPKALAIKGIS